MLTSGDGAGLIIDFVARLAIDLTEPPVLVLACVVAGEAGLLADLGERSDVAVLGETCEVGTLVAVTLLCGLRFVEPRKLRGDQRFTVRSRWAAAENMAAGKAPADTTRRDKARDEVR